MNGLPGLCLWAEWNDGELAMKLGLAGSEALPVVGQRMEFKDQLLEVSFVGKRFEAREPNCVWTVIVRLKRVSEVPRPKPVITVPASSGAEARPAVLEQVKVEGKAVAARQALPVTKREVCWAGKSLKMGMALSKGQREVARLIALGWENEEIARELLVTAKTVEKQRAIAMFKTGCKNAVHLAHWCLANGVCELMVRH